MVHSCFLFTNTLAATAYRIILLFTLIVSGLTNLDSGSGEGEISLENELKQYSYYACARRDNRRKIGYGYAGSEVEVDVGQCRLEQRHVSYENMVESDELEEACMNLHASCDPTELLVERVLTIEGIQEIQSIKNCGCERRKSCTRHPLHITFHGGTPYETTVDVGTCRGPCHHTSKKHCQPSRNKTITVPGPNGDRCMSIIVGCSCSRPCYRMSRFEAVYDYSNETDKEPRLMEIDVGQCVGGCSSEKRAECVQVRRSQSGTECRSYIYRSTKCSPVNLTLHTYRDSRGKENHIAAFEDCNCV